MKIHGLSRQVVSHGIGLSRQVSLYQDNHTSYITGERVSGPKHMYTGLFPFIITMLAQTTHFTGLTSCYAVKASCSKIRNH